MLRASLLAAGLLTVFGGAAQAQTNFDATGQFTLSFKFSQPGKVQEKPKPKLGFRFGASNVPQVRIEENDPTRSGLNLDFDRRDKAIQSFAGVQVQFGEADERTIRLLDDAFSPAALGLAEGAPIYAGGDGRIADYLKGDRGGGTDLTWSLGSNQVTPFGWAGTPLSD